MWIICNGAPKGGSTWLIQLLRQTKECARVPKELQNPIWINSSVDNRKLSEAKMILPSSPEKYYSKQHWAARHASLLEVKEVRVANIIRDIRDVVVSRYHHNVRLFGETKTLGQFINEGASEYIRKYVNYHRYWIDAGSKYPSRYFITSYEKLTLDLISGAQELYLFCNISLPPEQLAEAAEKTRFDKKNATGPGQFFRKGKMLAASDEITETENELILDSCKEAGFLAVKRKIVDFNPGLQKYCQLTDIGI